MKKTRKSKDMKKIHASIREMLQHGVGNSIWVGSDGRGKVGCHRKKFNEDQRVEKPRQFRSTMPDGAQISSLWLCYAKPLAERQIVRSQVVGIN